MMDEDRQKMLDEAMEHLNQAAILLGKVIDAEECIYPVIGLSYDAFNEPDIIGIHMGCNFPDDLMQEATRSEHDYDFDKITVRNGNLELYQLVRKEGSDQA